MSVLLATAIDLERWANRLDSSGDLPKLVRQLILATEEDITQLDMRAGEGTRYEGYDGMVVAGKGDAFVPPDRSVWEMGVTKGVKGKADGDYAKRTESPGDIDPSQTVFVFVTPRRWAGKNAWVEEKRKAGEWRDVRVVDADDLETWLHLAPAVHVWISGLVGKDPGDCEDLETFGQHWREATLPPLPSELILAGRAASVERLIAFVRGQAGIFTVQADSQEEALVFIAATIEQLSPNERDALFARTVIVRTEHAWRQITQTEQPLVLLPTFQLTGTQVPRSHHHVLIAVGQELAKTQAMEVLPRPPRRLVEEALKGVGLSQERASSLALIGRRSLLALRRQLSPNPEIHQPAWADADKARVIVPIMLVGSWDELVPGDKQTIEALTGRPYMDVAKSLVRYTTASDPPLRRVGTVWFVTSKEDAWRLLAQFLIQQDIECFQRVAIEVLSVVDPALELPLEQQWMANALEKSRPHSRFLREGIADTIALMAVRAGTDVLGGTTTGQDHATAIVMQLLEQANEDWSGQIWISLSDVLPLLAEAAPDAFLRAIEKATIGKDPLILKLFTDQEGNSFTTRSAHPPLLWALERLAWSPDYLSRVALVLARLAQIDPGGHLGNRPGSSLRQIFLAWYPQTAATLEQRLQVLSLLRKRVPVQAWKLMLSLLPHPGEGTDLTDSPQWREWKLEEQEPTVNSVELWSAIEAVVTWMGEDIGTDATRVCDLVERVGDLPSSSRRIVFDVLESLDPSAFDIRGCDAIWAKLRQHIADHRKYAHAQWAMPSSEVDRLAALYERFQPEDPIQQVAWLFTRWPQLVDTVDNNGTQPEAAIYEAQVAAAQHVYHSQGIAGLFSLIEAVEQPWILGWVLGRGKLVEAEENQLLNELGSSDGKRRQTAGGYVAGRFLEDGWEWVDETLGTNDFLHTSTQRADFLLNLPYRTETWDRLAQSDHDTKVFYWTQVPPRVDNDPDSLRVVEQLLAYDRAWQALDLLACTLEKVSPRTEIVLNVLEQAIRTPINPSVEHTIATSLYSDISRLLDYISQSGEVDEGRLARIEWALLLLFRYEQRSFNILHRQLARDPAFFVDLVSAAYRASGEEPSEGDEQRQFLAKQAHALLHSACVVPGTQGDGTIDPTKLLEWVHEARRLLTDCKRLRIGDEWIGHLLHHAKPDNDGVLLPEVIRDLLETVSSEEIELGLVIAISNERGAQWRNPLAGGHQERQMAEQYRLQAQSFQFLWPRTAEVLKGLAQGYEAQARFNDCKADLRQDGW